MENPMIFMGKPTDSSRFPLTSHPIRYINGLVLRETLQENRRIPVKIFPNKPIQW